MKSSGAIYRTNSNFFTPGGVNKGSNPFKKEGG